MCFVYKTQLIAHCPCSAMRCAMLPLGRWPTSAKTLGKTSRKTQKIQNSDHQHNSCLLGAVTLHIRRFGSSLLSSAWWPCSTCWRCSAWVDTGASFPYSSNSVYGKSLHQISGEVAICANKNSQIFSAWHKVILWFPGLIQPHSFQQCVWPDTVWWTAPHNSSGKSEPWQPPQLGKSKVSIPRIAFLTSSMGLLCQGFLNQDTQCSSPWNQLSKPLGWCCSWGVLGAHRCLGDNVLVSWGTVLGNSSPWAPTSFPGAACGLALSAFNSDAPEVDLVELCVGIYSCSKNWPIRRNKKMINGSHFTKCRSEGHECIKPGVSQRCLAFPPVGHEGCFGVGGPHTSFWTVSRGPCCLGTPYRFEDTNGQELPRAHPGVPRALATPDVLRYHLAPLARLSQSPIKAFSSAGMSSHLGQENFLLEELGPNFLFLKAALWFIFWDKVFKDPEANPTSDGRSWYCRWSK